MTNGFDAGRLLYTFSPDIIILDLIMPGLDGFEVCRNIKSDPLTKHMKIIAVTGYPSRDNIQKIKSEGASSYMVKPLDYRELHKTIKSLAMSGH